MLSEATRKLRGPALREAGSRLPGPRGAQLLGSLLDVRRDRLGFLLRVTRQYGDFVGFRMGPRSLVLVNDPAAAHSILRDPGQSFRKGIGLSQARAFLGDGLLTSDGDLWAAQRRELQGLFHADRLPQLSRAIVAAARDLAERWEARRAAGEPVEAGREMEGLALDVLGRTLLRGDLRSEPGLSESFAVLQRWAMRRMTSLWETPPAWPSPGNLRARKARRRLHEVVDRLIREHRGERPAGGRDALDVLLSGARAADPAALRGEVATLLLAGHETSASALAWIWVLLARHPEVRERLEAELSAVLGEREPAFDDVPRLVYARMVVQEALRLYPPVWMLPRRAAEDVEIAGCRVPAGAEILISPWALHRHPELWDSPESFRPERFDPAGPGHPAPAYLPFGHGPRACLGSGFGMLEILLVLATVARRFRLEPAPGFRAEPEALLSLRPHPGLWMRLA